MPTDQDIQVIDPQLIADFADTEMSATQSYWARVSVTAAELDPHAAAVDNEIRKQNPKHRNGYMAVSTKVIFVTSLKTPIKGIRGGRVVSTPPLLAAKLIVDGTHRLATPAEIEGWEKEQKARVAQAEAVAAAQAPKLAPIVVQMAAPAPEAFREPRRGSDQAGRTSELKQ